MCEERCWQSRERKARFTVAQQTLLGADSPCVKAVATRGQLSVNSDTVNTLGWGLVRVQRWLQSNHSSY